MAVGPEGEVQSWIPFGSMFYPWFHGSGRGWGLYRLEVPKSDGRSEHCKASCKLQQEEIKGAVRSPFGP